MESTAPGRLAKQISFFENLSKNSNHHSDTNGIAYVGHDKATKPASNNLPNNPPLQTRSVSLVAGEDGLRNGSSMQNSPILHENPRVQIKPDISQNKPGRGQKISQGSGNTSAEKAKVPEGSILSQSSSQPERVLAPSKQIVQKSDQNGLQNSGTTTKSANEISNNNSVDISKLDCFVSNNSNMPLSEVPENENFEIKNLTKSINRTSNRSSVAKENIVSRDGSQPTYVNSGSKISANMSLMEELKNRISAISSVGISKSENLVIRKGNAPLYVNAENKNSANTNLITKSGSGISNSSAGLSKSENLVSGRNGVPTCLLPEGSNVANDSLTTKSENEKSNNISVGISEINNNSIDASKFEDSVSRDSDTPMCDIFANQSSTLKLRTDVSSAWQSTSNKTPSLSGSLSSSTDGYLSGSSRRQPRQNPELLSEYERRKRQLGVRIEESVTSSTSRQNSLENDLRDVDDLSLSSPSTADSGIQPDIHTVKQTVRWADERTNRLLIDSRHTEADESNIIVEIETGDEPENKDILTNNDQSSKNVQERITYTSSSDMCNPVNKDIFIMNAAENDVADKVERRTAAETAVNSAVATCRPKSANAATSLSNSSVASIGLTNATIAANSSVTNLASPVNATNAKQVVAAIRSTNTINTNSSFAPSINATTAATSSVASTRSDNVTVVNPTTSFAGGDVIIKSADKLEPTRPLHTEISSEGSIQPPFLQSNSVIHETRPEVTAPRPNDREREFENSSENQNYGSPRGESDQEISDTLEQATGVGSAGSGNRNNLDGSERSLDGDGLGLSCIEAECTLLSDDANRPSTTYNIYRVIKKKKKKILAADENSNMTDAHEKEAKLTFSAELEGDDETRRVHDTRRAPLTSASFRRKLEVTTNGQENMELSQDTRAFRARFLGSLPVSADELTALDHGASRITRCINQFNENSNNNNKTLRRQNSDPGTERVLLEFVGHVLHIIRMIDDVTLDSLSVGSIRVWGVGKDPESKDFAFVARDLITDVHMCHVFRCERPAQHVSNTLRNICLRLANNSKRDATMSRNYVTNPSRIRRSHRSETGSSARRIDRDLGQGTRVYQRRSERRESDISRGSPGRVRRNRSGSGSRERSGSSERGERESMSRDINGGTRRGSQRSNATRSSREDDVTNSETVVEVSVRTGSRRNSVRIEDLHDLTDDDTEPPRRDDSLRRSMSHSSRHVEFKEIGREISAEVRAASDDTDTDVERDHNQNSKISNLTEIFHCLYLGRVQVKKATGMDVLNNAMQYLHSRVPVASWIPVDVTVEAASATVSISTRMNPDEIMYEGHLRTLTFLGISINNAKLGSFIVHTLRNEFIAHVFHFEGTAGPWCRAIQNICTLHYQQCIENRQRVRTLRSSSGSRVVRDDQGEQQQQQQQQQLMHQRSFVHRLFNNGPQMIRPRAYISRRSTSSAM